MSWGGGVFTLKCVSVVGDMVFTLRCVSVVGEVVFTLRCVSVVVGGGGTLKTNVFLVRRDWVLQERIWSLREVCSSFVPAAMIKEHWQKAAQGRKGFTDSQFQVTAWRGGI